METACRSFLPLWQLLVWFTSNACYNRDSKLPPLWRGEKIIMPPPYSRKRVHDLALADPGQDGRQVYPGPKSPPQPGRTFRWDAPVSDRLLLGEIRPQ